MGLTDEQWQRIASHLPPEQLQHGGRQGRPFKDARAVLDGVLWILHTGAVAPDAEALPAVPDLPPTVPGVG